MVPEKGSENPPPNSLFLGLAVKEFWRCSEGNGVESTLVGNVVLLVLLLFTMFEFMVFVMLIILLLFNVLLSASRECCLFRGVLVIAIE